MNPAEEKQLGELVSLYTKTKKLVLQAEQLDPECRSNIAIFKEQRDALDHLMRALQDALPPVAAPRPDYFTLQIDKAKGHLFRAAYDALDGLAISCKIRIAEAMTGVSNEAISAVYPEYYDHLTEIERIDLEIADRRNEKDVGDPTLDNLNAYQVEVERLCKLVVQCRAKAKPVREWDKRDARSQVRNKVLWPALGAVGGAALGYYIR